MANATRAEQDRVSRRLQRNEKHRLRRKGRKPRGRGYFAHGPTGKTHAPMPHEVARDEYSVKRKESQGIFRRIAKWLGF